MSSEERELLERTLRAKATEEEVRRRLREVNVSASRRNAVEEKSKYRYASGLISEGCYSASINALGRGASEPHLTSEQTGDFIPPDMAWFLEQSGLQLRPKIGPDGKPMPIILRGSTSVVQNPSKSYFREQFKLDPNNSELWNNYGSWLSSNQRTADARSAFERAIEIDPANATATANLAKRLFFDIADAEGAVGLYERAVEISEPDVPGWILSDFADALASLPGSASRAAALHERAAGDVNFPAAVARRALFIANSGGNISDAQRLMQVALERQPNNVDILRMSNAFNIEHVRDYTAARAAVEDILRFVPDDPDALRQLGDFALIDHEPEAAVQFYRIALKHGLEPTILRGSYGLALLCSRRPKAAIHQFRKAMRLLPGEPDVMVNAAAAMFVLGDAREATSLLSQVLSSEPSAELDLESSAMILIGAEVANADGIRRRIAELVEAGVTTDDLALRAVAESLRDADRKSFGAYVSDVVTGKRSAAEL
ncbi:tetratricopeptide repeat protein [Actinoplanes sp. KI2]|uniref:tetratricopeptide repeat protein n=1 Tax=Actinoplanes sp. KI2 TaxID=2983315 RepID=UPI0021D5EA59|nr:tetratricopeptide repeat protein [Actinoplanes sp. KI2]MCU7730913.1 tetratricopeptide repeat protein [Actinoplanes sp. KI2]